MKKAILWLLAFGVLVTGVLGVWELVAAPGPLRKAWWAYKAYRNPVYITQTQFTLLKPMSEEQLAIENQLLDSMDLLLPLVKKLGLKEQLGVPSDAAAAVRLAEASNLRKGPGALQIELYVQSSDKEFLKKVTKPLVKAYIEKRQAMAAAARARGN
jgi:uncharacterized protein involved in exopolysaccharide biosynthesis